MNDAFGILAELGTAKRRRRLPWLLLVVAPLGAFASVFVILGLLQESVLTAIFGSHVVTLSILLLWGIASRVGLATQYETVVTALPENSRLFERRYSKGNTVPVTIIVPDSGRHWKFTGYRPKNGNRIIVETAERVEKSTKPARNKEVASNEYTYLESRSP